MAGIIGHVPEVKISIKPPELKLVDCPHCGYHEALIVEREGDAIQIENFKQPRRCGGCGNYYQLVWRLDISAAKLGGQ